MRFKVLNPLEVIKIRLQLQGRSNCRIKRFIHFFDNYSGELANEKSVSASQRIYGADRKYKGTLRGALKIMQVGLAISSFYHPQFVILQQERLSGLYKGFLPALMREAM